MKNYLFDIKSINDTFKKKDNYVLINKGDIKIVYIKTSEHNLNFTIGADSSVQYQMLEALMECLIEAFMDEYKAIISNYTTGSNMTFKQFGSKIEELIDIFPTLNLVTFVPIFCSVCKRSHTLVIKNSLINKSPKTIVPIVFYHEGITLLVYIDHNFQPRGVEIVAITG